MSLLRWIAIDFGILASGGTLEADVVHPPPPPVSAEVLGLTNESYPGVLRCHGFARDPLNPDVLHEFTFIAAPGLLDHDMLLNGEHPLLSCVLEGEGGE